jgi:hypothetical protein
LQQSRLAFSLPFDCFQWLSWLLLTLQAIIRINSEVNWISLIAELRIFDVFCLCRMTERKCNQSCFLWICFAEFKWRKTHNTTYCMGDIISRMLIFMIFLIQTLFRVFKFTDLSHWTIIHVLFRFINWYSQFFKFADVWSPQI